METQLEKDGKYYVKSLSIFKAHIYNDTTHTVMVFGIERVQTASLKNPLYVS